MTNRLRLTGPRRAAMAGCFLTLGVAIAGVAIAATQAKQATTITVLVDQTRAPDVQAYAKKHPELDVQVAVTGDSVLPRVRLALQAGSGVPDVIFDSNPASTTGALFQIYAGDLGQYIPTAVQAKFIEKSLDACRLGGKLLCIRNDLAQDVLWVNSTLFKQFGYKVPQTWQQYKEVGLRLAQEHPGYSIGPFSGWGAVVDMYYGAFQCPYNQVLGPKTVRINLRAPGCLRMYATLDPLLKAGVLGNKVQVFGSDGAQLGKDNKYLMMIGPSWWGDFVLKAFYSVPTGQWTANQSMAWGKEPRVTGSAGGGVWMYYKKSANAKLAAQLIREITTDVPRSATKPTYPTWGPSVPVWTARVARDDFWSRSPVPALNAAAGRLTPTVSYARYDYGIVYSTVIDPGVRDGKSLASLAGPTEAALTKLAQQSGYKVVK